MLAAGIEASALEELETHLREGIAQHMRSGLGEQRAFEAAACQIGKGAELKKEFAKDGGLFGFLGKDKFTRTNRILGTLWFVFCSVILLQSLRFRTANLLADELRIAIYGTGLYGSILLIRGVPMGRKIIRIIATALAVTGLPLVFSLLFTVGSCPVISILNSFYIISAWLLFTPSFSKPAPANK